MLIFCHNPRVEKVVALEGTGNNLVGLLVSPDTGILGSLV
jgi:hypothetical protein